MTIKLGYARVSTTGQSTETQIEQLREAGCSEVFVDNAISGSRNHLSLEYRNLFDRAKELREQGEEVTVIVTKLDRFSRSTKALLEGVEELAQTGASFYSLSDSFRYDANSPTSELILTMLGAVATFERSLIKSRMAEGRAAAVAKGVRLGPKPKLNAAAVRSIRADYATGTTTDRRLAKEWGVSRSTIARVLNLYGNTTAYVTLDEWESARKGSKN